MSSESSPDVTSPFMVDYESETETPKNRPGTRTIAKHLGLFLITLAFVSLTGVNFVGFSPALFPLELPALPDIWRGFIFACLLLGFLTVHEFGHYFAAVYHNIAVSLPYYIPLPIGIGTLGAVIRIRERIRHMHQLFDIGIAGPLAGFVMSILILLIGFMTLPEPEFMLQFDGHDELKAHISVFGEFPDEVTDSSELGTLTVGNTLLYSFLASFFEDAPPMWEMYHYPFLFAGWLGLFFTALNLMPVGQLDGGHVLYALLGYKRHQVVARLFFTFITILAGVEAVPFIHETLGAWDTAYGTVSWLIWSAILLIIMNTAFKGDQRWVAAMFTISLLSTGVYAFLIAAEPLASSSMIWVVWMIFITFFVKIEHPPVEIEASLSKRRIILGWISMCIFVLCISLNPLSL
ncbi:MAG: site-2 protease family protein [Bacteroidota bacterium]